MCVDACMCVCGCVWVCVCVRACVHLCVLVRGGCVCAFAYACAHMCAPTTFTYTCACVYLNVIIFARMCVCVRVCECCIYTVVSDVLFYAESAHRDRILASVATQINSFYEEFTRKYPASSGNLHIIAHSVRLVAVAVYVCSGRGCVRVVAVTVCACKSKIYTS